MQQLFCRHTLSLVAVLFVVLLLAACRFATDPSEKADQLKTNTAETVPAPGFPVKSKTTSQPIVFEEPILPRAESSTDNTPKEKTALSSENKGNRPRVAIIIDDMGYHRKIGDKLLALDLNLTFSFLPEAPFALQQEEQAYQSGRDIMAHLPMESSDARWDPGPGALYLSASPEEQIATLKKNLAAVPHAIGANNHMGSKFTQNRQAMRRIVTVLKAQGFFFIDSFTTAESTGLAEARAIGLKSNRRHVFLDNVQDPEKICIQLDKLAALAVKQHPAIGIGHPYQATLDALQKCRGVLLETVQVVPVHELLQ